jgi:alpha-glucosidase
MDGYRVFTVNQERFPGLRRLSKELHDQGVKLVTILDPGVKVDPGFDLYRQGLEAGMFCSLPGGHPLVGLVWPGNTVFPDFTNPKVRKWWGKQYSGLLAEGVDGFWHDMNEPESFSASGDMTLPLATCHSLEGRGGDHHQAHNLYGFLMNRAGYEGLLRHRPERRPWIISRAGWAGSSRYAWNWTGDIESTWEGLRLTIAMVLNLGLSGQPFSGVDIGGFTGDPEAELYLRWFQAAAFLPFFRTHSAVGTARREPWVYGEPYTSIIRQALQLRYRLLPYLYTLAREAAETGHPLVRPLFWNDLTDRRLWEIDDTFLLGDALLVAPVLESGMSTRKLVLPPGPWYDFWEDHLLQDSDTLNLPVSLDHIPVLVRAGKVLTLEENGNLNLHIYPAHNPARYTSRLYLDAGDGEPCIANPQSTINYRDDRMVVEQTNDSLDLSWDSSGRFPLPYSLIQVHLHRLKARRAWVDGREVHLSLGPILTRGFQNLRYEVSSQ